MPCLMVTQTQLLGGKTFCSGSVQCRCLVVVPLSRGLVCPHAALTVSCCPGACAAGKVGMMWRANFACCCDLSLRCFATERKPLSFSKQALQKPFYLAGQSREKQTTAPSSYCTSGSFAVAHTFQSEGGCHSFAIAMARFVVLRSLGMSGNSTPVRRCSRSRIAARGIART